MSLFTRVVSGAWCVVSGSGFRARTQRGCD